LSTVWQEFRALHALKPQIVQRGWGRRRQHFSWVNDIDYAFAANGRQRLKLNLVVCEESWEKIDEQARTVTETSRHAWLSSQPLSQDNVHERCNLCPPPLGHRSGLSSSHQGYHYEHAFALDWNSMNKAITSSCAWRMCFTLARFTRQLRDLYQAVPSPSSEAPAPPPGSTQHAFACSSPSHSCFNLSELTQASPKHPLKRGVRRVKARLAIVPPFVSRVRHPPSLYSLLVGPRLIPWRGRGADYSPRGWRPVCGATGAAVPTGLLAGRRGKAAIRFQSLCGK
jgi:hypothetical protein